MKFVFFCTDYHNNIFGYYNVIGSGNLPHWYDVNYAYSGLHSIIHPPPTEVDIWGTIIIPIFQLNRKMAECEFCFENYAEYKCQFYSPRNPQYKFAKKNRNGGKLILCECCDYDDDNNVDENTSFTTAPDNNMASDELSTGDDGGTGANTDDYGTEDNNSDEKRAKLDILRNCEEKISIPKIVQPGWYGKGYRKMFRRKRK